MTYFEGVLWLLTWPVLIVISYYLVRLALNKTEQSLPEQNDK